MLNVGMVREAKKYLYSHKEFELKEVECSHCKGTFNVKTIEW